MKKDSFMKGAFVATLCIVLSKILGIIYVIPFHAIIGPNGRTLYSYAYNMYTLFLSFSTVGIPLAISKIVSEYNVLEYNDAKKRTYKLAIKITLTISTILTIVLFVFAPSIAHMIIGDLEGGNTLEDITFVLRVAASALIIVTMLSCLRGYLQGHKYITASSISEVIEQFVRITIIIAGSYVAVRLWGTKEVIGVAMSGATIGALVAFGYLITKVRKQKSIEKNYEIKEEEKKITNKDLFKKLLKYTIPFVLASVMISVYNSIDVVTVIQALVKYGGIEVTNAETILSVITTWGNKLNSIVTAIASGMVISALPNITGDYVKKDMDAVQNKINNALQIILFLVIPMVVGLSILSEPVWSIFYSKSDLCVSVFSYSIFTALFYSLFLNTYIIMQSTNRQKIANIALVLGIIVKLSLNIPLIILFSKINFIPIYYGSVTATMLAYTVSIVINLTHLKNNMKINLSSTFKIFGRVMFSTLVMILSLLLLKLIVPLSGGRMYSLLITIIYTLVGAIIYGFINVKNGTFNKVFHCNVKEFIKSKIRRKAD